MAFNISKRTGIIIASWIFFLDAIYGIISNLIKIINPDDSNNPFYTISSIIISIISFVSVGMLLSGINNLNAFYLKQFKYIYGMSLFFTLISIIIILAFFEEFSKYYQPIQSKTLLIIGLIIGYIIMLSYYFTTIKYIKELHKDINEKKK